MIGMNRGIIVNSVNINGPAFKIIVNAKIQNWCIFSVKQIFILHIKRIILPVVNVGNLNQLLDGCIARKPAKLDFEEFRTAKCSALCLGCE